MKVAVIQLQASSQKQDNCAKAIEFFHKAVAQKAEFILLPELFIFQGKPAMRKQSIAESIPGETTRTFMKLAKKNKVQVLCGSIYEKISKSRYIYNTSVLINSKGQIQARYRKNHLFDAILGRKKIKESDRFRAGKRGSLTSVKGFRTGLSICYDLRFPEFYRRYSQKGVDVLCVPSAFTHQTGQAHWETLLRSRAIENLAYVLAPNQCGVDGKGILNFGNSMIVDPWGKVLAKASAKKEEIIFAKINKNEIQKRRRILPSFK